MDDASRTALVTARFRASLRDQLVHERTIGRDDSADEMACSAYPLVDRPNTDLAVLQSDHHLITGAQAQRLPIAGRDDDPPAIGDSRDRLCHSIPTLPSSFDRRDDRSASPVVCRISPMTRAR